MKPLELIQLKENVRKLFHLGFNTQEIAHYIEKAVEVNHKKAVATQDRILAYELRKTLD